MCDLTDPRILETYTVIVENGPTNWLILGYNDTRDVISLYTKGSEGISEFCNNLSDEVLYGFFRIEDRFVLITWVPEQVSGVRRARALVHSRSVASLLKLHDAQLTVSNQSDLSEANIRNRLKLGENQVLSRRSSISASQKEPSHQLSTSPINPSSLSLPPEENQIQHDEFVEANEDVFSTPPTTISSAVTAAAAAAAAVAIPSLSGSEEDINELEIQRQKEEEEEEQARLLILRKQQEEEEEEKARRRKIEEEEREAAAAAEEEAKRIAAEQEAKRLEEERILREKMEAERLAEEKRLLQQRLLEAEKNKDIILSGFISIQPSTSPFWRRFYFIIKGKSMTFYRDELSSKPIIILDLNNVKRLSKVNIDIETFVPNAFVLETQQNGLHQLYADDKKSLETILTALQTVI
ncbi:uncharacterized protein BX663DRAFT_536187 [Cokeromyces recurvatus]|uniref:uncharacterized protein n=1 Tax=Cokeromyces recurvatus TaxID=90255 RepID=UPI00221E9058|nr:uncharacterized protein BX663DRAFT_536187 [Cokeromyces recurvatus]KAI7903764.1 hypothetical protein BX663DRAFT_536187 [Cokeromyces recurvatus]